MASSEDSDPVFYYGGAAAQLYKLENARTAIGTEVSFNASVPAAITSDFINGITINPVNKYQIFVAFTTVSNQGRVWKASKLETTTPLWENISGNLPPGLPVNMVAVDPQDPENKTKKDETKKDNSKKEEFIEIDINSNDGIFLNCNYI